MAHTSENLTWKKGGKHETSSSPWFVTHDRLRKYVKSTVSESVIFKTVLVADVWVFASIRENFLLNLVKKWKKVRLVLEIGPKLINLITYVRLYVV